MSNQQYQRYRLSLNIAMLIALLIFSIPIIAQHTTSIWSVVDFIYVVSLFAMHQLFLIFFLVFMFSIAISFMVRRNLVSTFISNRGGWMRVCNQLFNLIPFMVLLYLSAEYDFNITFSIIILWSLLNFTLKGMDRYITYDRQRKESLQRKAHKLERIRNR